MEACILKTEELSKSYGNTKILKKIDFNMGKSDYVAVMGPSGAGKSTFLHMISGMDRSSSGKVYIDGNELAHMTGKKIAALRLKKIGMVFQQPSLLPTLNLLDNVMLPAYMLKSESTENINKLAIDLLTQFGIVEKKDSSIGTLSGGQLQRGCVARALINKPLILFADEPTGALNSDATNHVMEVLKTVNDNGTAILIVTHDIKVAARAKRVVYLLDGVIKEQISFELNSAREDREKQIQCWMNKF